MIGLEKYVPILYKNAGSFCCSQCYPLIMFSDLTDTSPEIEALQLKLLRQASPARKLELLAQMNATDKALALFGLRTRHPGGPPKHHPAQLGYALMGEICPHCEA